MTHFLFAKLLILNRFVKAWEAQEGNMAELCRRFGISRQTGYEVLVTGPQRLPQS